LRVGDAEGAARASLDASSATEAMGVLEDGLADSVDLDLFDAGWLPRHRSATSLQRRRASRSR
jgi:hypothetical protein